MRGVEAEVGSVALTALALGWWLPRWPWFTAGGLVLVAACAGFLDFAFLVPGYIDTPPEQFVPAVLLGSGAGGLASGAFLRAAGDRRVGLAAAAALTAVLALTCAGFTFTDWSTSMRLQTAGRIVEVQADLCMELPGPFPADLSQARWIPDYATLADSWGQPLRYLPAADGRSAVVASTGRDGEFGTDDDLVAHLPDACSTPLN